jgi:arylsulfatase A-like enzyme
MAKHPLLKSVIVAALIGSSTCLSAAAQRPNVLFLAVDDMNDWIGSHQTTPRAITPNLDRLAARGVNFMNAHTAGVFCAPSRAAIFSGQHASTTGCYSSANYFVDQPEIEALQMSFSKAGYTTLGAGKLFHHPGGAIDQRGWTEFFVRKQSQRLNGWPLDSWSEEMPLPKEIPASSYNQGQQVTGGLYLDWAPIPNEKEEEMADTIRINWAVEQLKKMHDQPFFLGVGIYAPHFPNYCPQKYFDLYDPEKIKLPPMKSDDINDLPAKIKKQRTTRLKIHQRLEDLDAVDDAIHGYLACISYADAMMGRVLDTLAASPHADNTIVVLWSDHGYHHGEKGHWGKHTLWERTSNVPFIWAGPGVAKGAKTDATVSLIDMYPTFVEMCDLPKPHQQLEGKSLATTLANPATAKDRNVYLPYMSPGEYAVINRDWRYIRYGKDGEELYDLKNDPNEWTNLAAIGEYAPVKKQLQQTAPKTFAKPQPKMIVQRDLVVAGESYYWEMNAKRNGKKTASRDTKAYVEAANAKLKKPKTPSRRPKKQTKSYAPKPKNVLFIVCDDLNTHVSTSGYPHISTPAFDHLAAEGMTFKRAYCQYPVCGPSRASLLHGLYPQSTGILSNKTDIRKVRPGTVSLPQRFKESGYWTGAVGKVFHNPKVDPGDVAWHQMLRFENDEMPVVTPIRKNFEAEHGPVTEGKSRRKWREFYPTIAKQTKGQKPGWGPTGLRDEQHNDGKNARQIAAWLEKGAHGDQPFFMACGIQKPHIPFLAPDKYFEMYPPAELKFTPASLEFWKQAPKIAQTKRYEGFGFEFGVENDALRREYMQAYHACISFIDAQIGLVFDALKRSGHWDDTIVVLTSDHGYLLGEKFMWGKVMLFETCDRVPLVIRVPGQTRSGSSSEGLVELVDLYPTLAELCGVQAPADLQGKSLVPMLRDPKAPGKEVAYTVVTRGTALGKAIRTDRWRYAKWPNGEELYDLHNDPSENRNLIKSAGHAETLKTMREKLERAEQRAISAKR